MAAVADAATITQVAHDFTRDELVRLAADAGFTASTICHTSDLGETWDNVFVGLCG